MIFARVQGSWPGALPPPSCLSLRTGVPHTTGRGSRSPSLLSHKGLYFTKTRQTDFFGLCTHLPPPPNGRTDTDAAWASFRGRVSEGIFNPPANSFTSRDKKLKGSGRLYFCSREQVLMF